MDANADITCQKQESTYMIATILSLQPRETGGGDGKSSDDIVLDLAAEIKCQVPEILDDEKAGPNTFVVLPSGLISSATKSTPTTLPHPREQSPSRTLSFVTMRNENTKLVSFSTTYRRHTTHARRSIDTVLAQEMVKFNRLIARMASTLETLGRAIKGLVVMSLELDKMYTSFMINQVRCNKATLVITTTAQPKSSPVFTPHHTIPSMLLLSND